VEATTSPQISAEKTAPSGRESGSDLLEQRVRERTRELTTLLDVSRAVASTLELKPLLGVICEQLSLVTGSHGAAISLLDGAELVLVASKIAPEEVGRRVPVVTTSPVYTVISDGLPVTIADVLGDSLAARAYLNVVNQQQHTALTDVRSLMWVPLIYRDEIIGVLGASHPEPDFFSAHHAELAMAIANQAAVGIENARLHEQTLRHAAIEERQRLARELHDSVSQALYGIGLGAQTALIWLEREDSARTGESLAYILELANTGLAEMRALIFELRPETLERDGLVKALERQVAALSARHRLAIQTTLGGEPDVPLSTKEALYRVGQEALQNTVKHARARTVHVAVESDLNWVSLDVQDDGVGFDTAGDFPGHLGLHSMRERVEHLGGTLRIDSAPGHGTRIVARVPATNRSSPTATPAPTPSPDPMGRSAG
jgi:signal transduction histidine kinase